MLPNTLKIILLGTASYILSFLLLHGGYLCLGMYLQCFLNTILMGSSLKRICACQTDIPIKQMGENHVSFLQKEGIF